MSLGYGGVQGGGVLAIRYTSVLLMTIKTIHEARTTGRPARGGTGGRVEN